MKAKTNFNKFSRWKEETFPNNGPNWSITEALDDWMHARSRIWERHENHVGPSGPGVPADDFLQQLTKEVPDLEFMTARRYHLTTAGMPRPPLKDLHMFHQDRDKLQTHYHGTRMELLANFLCDGKVVESTGERTRSNIDGFYTMRSNTIYKAMGYAVVSPVFNNRYLVGALLECAAVSSNRGGSRAKLDDQYPFAARHVDVRSVILFAFSVDHMPDMQLYMQERWDPRLELVLPSTKAPPLVP